MCVQVWEACLSADGRPHPGGWLQRVFAPLITLGLVVRLHAFSPSPSLSLCFAVQPQVRRQLSHLRGAKLGKLQQLFRRPRPAGRSVCCKHTVHRGSVNRLPPGTGAGSPLRD